MADVKARLEELAAALEGVGIKSHLSAGDPPLLHVVNPDPPPLGEQIGCCSVGGDLWFQWTALEVRLGPASQVREAAERIRYILGKSAKPTGSE